jgi:hypothetical protein
MAVALAGCGNTRIKLGSRSPDPVLRELTAARPLPNTGIVIARPGGWSTSSGRNPLVVQYQSSQAVIAIWSYKRVEPLPSTPGQLDRARRALIKASQARDRTMKVISSKTLKVGGLPAAEVLADVRVADAARRVRSLHVFGRGSEVVVDAYAPKAGFDRVDRAVFQPLGRTLRLRAPRKA